jgi:hypothetical protein
MESAQSVAIRKLTLVLLAITFCASTGGASIELAPQTAPLRKRCGQRDRWSDPTEWATACR